MKIGILGNIAGNIDALLDADRQFDAFGVEHRIAAGKIVGMYPYVDECIQHLKRSQYAAIRLPIDSEFAGAFEFRGWSKETLIGALRFSRTNFCSPASIQYLNSLPEILHYERFSVVGYLPGGMPIADDADARKGFETWTAQVVFHNAALHVGIWNDLLLYTQPQDGINKLDSMLRMLISVGGAGSLIEGSTNDRCPAALVFDTELFSIRRFRPKCDLHAILHRLDRVGYPSECIEILRRREYRNWMLPKPI